MGMMFNVDAFLLPAAGVIVASFAGMGAATWGLVVETRHRRAALAASEAWAAAQDRLEHVLADPGPEVEAITGELEIVRVCVHLGFLDRMDGRRCPDCDPT